MCTAGAGFDPAHPQLYDLPRAGVQPPEELLLLMFKGLEEEAAKVEQARVVTATFLRVCGVRVARYVNVIRNVYV